MTEWALLQVLSRDYFVTSWLADRSKVSAHPLDEILGSEQPVDVATSAPASRQPIMLWAYVAAHESDYPRDAHRSPASTGPRTCGTWSTWATPPPKLTGSSSESPHRNPADVT